MYLSLFLRPELAQPSWWGDIYPVILETAGAGMGPDLGHLVGNLVSNVKLRKTALMLFYCLGGFRAVPRPEEVRVGYLGRPPALKK